MTKMPLRAFLYICLFLVTTHVTSTHAAIVDYLTASVTVNPDNISTTSTDGVVINAYGYHAEFTSSTTANVYGPFPTTAGQRDLQIFGVDIDIPLSVTGLGLLAQSTGSLAPVEDDVETANYQPGFDNILLNTSAPPGIQFALFTFSEPVDVSQVVVGTSIGTGDIWAAGGSGPVPDLTTNFLDTLTSLGVQKHRDTVSGPQAIHNLSGLINIDFLLIGTPPRDNNYGPLTSDGRSNFFIDELNLAPTTIPVPAAIWLFGSGLLALVGMARRKKAA